MENHLLIRPATTGDVPALAQIERDCFSDPWSPRGIEETVQYETNRGFVAELEGRVVGYVMARISGEEAEILNLAVLPEFRRRGFARCLLQEALGAAAGLGVREVYLEVRESNVEAIGLYRGYGFRPVGMRSDYYRNPREDALVLRTLVPAVR